MYTINLVHNVGPCHDSTFNLHIEIIMVSLMIATPTNLDDKCIWPIDVRVVLARMPIKCES